MEKPRWLRDLLRFLPLKSQFVLSGNIQDLQAQEVTAGAVSSVPLQSALAIELYARGFNHVLAFDLIRGVRLLSKSGVPQAADSAIADLKLLPANDSQSPIERVGMLLHAVTAFEEAPVVLIIDFASRITVRNDALSGPEHTFFSRALVASLSSKPRPHGPNRTPFFNTVIWLVDKEGDLPDWMLLGNPRIRHIPVPKPDNIARRAIAPGLLKMLPGANDSDQDQLRKAEPAFVEETEGLLLMDLSAIAQLARSEGLTVPEISDAVRRYKVGVSDDPWKRIDRQKIRDAKSFIQTRVKGQEHAIVHALDIIKRAIMGVGGSKRGGRPRGVMFLAGPTGVGKTELAKTITSLLFGDEGAYIRFDMSEFSQEHSDQRLIGAPPGYVGYDIGGELTNAIREKPFSVVLFDEIEKSHPRILDKFLQILDDGVLTSGRGDRVYFSESLIIFTSNLGIYRSDALGGRTPNVTPDEDPHNVRQKVRSEIEQHFKLVLNRPEILNRIGENVIVFDFIRRPIAMAILDHMIDATLKDIERNGVIVSLSDSVRATIADLCLADLSNGGRGIRNKVELHLLNPLSRALFELEAAPGSSWVVSDISADETTEFVLSQSGARLL